MDPPVDESHLIFHVKVRGVAHAPDDGRRTDLLGEIRITTDGVSLWVESDNGEPEQLL